MSAINIIEASFKEEPLKVKEIFEAEMKTRLRNIIEAKKAEMVEGDTKDEDDENGDEDDEEEKEDSSKSVKENFFSKMTDFVMTDSDGTVSYEVLSNGGVIIKHVPFTTYKLDARAVNSIRKLPLGKSGFYRNGANSGRVEVKRMKDHYAITNMSYGEELTSRVDLSAFDV